MTTTVYRSIDALIAERVAPLVGTRAVDMEALVCELMDYEAIEVRDDGYHWRPFGASELAAVSQIIAEAAMRPMLTPKQPARVIITGTARPSQSSRAIVSYMHSPVRRARNRWSGPSGMPMEIPACRELRA